MTKVLKERRGKKRDRCIDDCSDQLSYSAAVMLTEYWKKHGKSTLVNKSVVSLWVGLQMSSGVGEKDKTTDLQKSNLCWK